VFSDSFRLKTPITRYVTLSHIYVSQLNAVGVVPPGRYRVRLWRGKSELAEGTFSLHT
jgi:hypothetical protein